MGRPKILTAVEAMINNIDNIQIIHKERKEYYFEYNNKYLWSISPKETDRGYNLYYYPEISHPKVITSINGGSWNDIDFVIFRSDEISSEAIELFERLHSSIEEKYFQIDKTLDDIISDDIPF